MSSSIAETKKLLDSIAVLHDAVGDAGFYKQIADFFVENVQCEFVGVFEFQRGLQPRHVYSSLTAFDNDMAKYLRGMYILDPYFDLYENQNRTGIHHLNPDRWSGFEESDFFKFYWRHTGQNDEVGGLYEIAEDRCIHVSVAFDSIEGVRAENATTFMQTTEAICQAMFKRHVFAPGHTELRDEVTRRALHKVVSATLAEFGEGILTDREQSVVQLLLRGHSAKSQARILSISPGTVSIHRSNIYRKLDISGQGELFSIFFTRLTSAIQ